MSEHAQCRRAASLSAAFLFILVGAPSAHAQQPPSPRPWTVMFGGGLTFQNGTTDQKGINLRGAAIRLTPGSAWAQQVDADLSYMTVSGPGFEQTVADNNSVRYLLRRQLTPRTFLAIRPAFKRNTVQGVDYRLEEIVGVGFVLAPHARLGLTVIPVAGSVQQEKNIPGIDKKTLTAGVTQTGTIILRQRRIDPATNQPAEPDDSSKIEQQFLYLTDVRNSEDRRLQAQVALENPIAGAFFVDFIYSVDHENLVLGGLEGTDQRLQVNFRIQLRF